MVNYRRREFQGTSVKHVDFIRNILRASRRQYRVRLKNLTCLPNPSRGGRLEQNLFAGKVFSVSPIFSSNKF